MDGFLFFDSSSLFATLFTMFKEVVSGAIMIGFVLNLAFVDHPDQKSYTIAFVIALVMECPFLAVWW